MKNLILVFVLLMSISYGFSAKVVVIPDLMNPGIIEIHENEIYILDGVLVHVYSLKDYRLLRKFGKQGEGPGELIPNDEITIQMRILEEDVFVNSQSKMIRFSKTGKLKMEKVFPFVAFQIVPFGKNYAVSTIGYNLGGTSLKVIILDGQLKELKQLYAASGLSSPLKGKLLVPPERLYIFRSEDKLVVVDTQKDFILNLFDLEGNSLKPIKIEYEPVEVTTSFRNEVFNWFKNDIRFKNIPEALKKMFDLPEHLPPIRDLIIHDNKIYVQTYKKKKNLTQFLILNFNGKLLKEFWLPQASEDIMKLNSNRTYTIYNNRYYYLIENMDTENWELHVEEIK